jgi:hypothetical protein
VFDLLRCEQCARCKACTLATSVDLFVVCFSTLALLAATPKRWHRLTVRHMGFRRLAGGGYLQASGGPHVAGFFALGLAPLLLADGSVA